MSLRKKTLLILSCTFLITVIAALAISLLIVRKSFADLQDEEMQQNMSRAVDTVQAEIDGIENSDRDWAFWDDSYRFISDRNEEYIKSNLAPDNSLLNIRLSFMLFVNNEGQVVYDKGADLNTEETVPVPESVLALAKDEQLTPGSSSESVKGIAMLPENPALIASVPILPSDGQGEAGGHLIFGRFLDLVQIEQMASITKLSTCINGLDESEVQQACAEIGDQKPANESEDGSGNISAFTIMNDFKGQPAFALRVEVPGSIHRRGDITIYYLIFSLIAGGVVFSLATFIPLERWVISRISRLSSQVSKIGRGSSHSSTVLIEGKDEISSLAGNIKSMLERLNGYHVNLEQALAIEQTQREELTRVNATLESVRETLARQAEELKALSIHDELTALYNRRGFMALAEVKNNIAKREEQQLLLIYADVDNLKQINDVFGHAEGDRALKEVGHLLKAVARESDLIARLGGDEYLVLATGSEARPFEVRLAESLAAHNEEKDRKYAISVSVGHVSFNPGDMSLLNEMIKEADKKMYAEKLRKKRES